MNLHTALINAGGFGTRMAELTTSMPKPMLPLQGKPILEHSIDLCKLHGINDIIISVLYLSDTIKNYFRDGSEFGVRIRYIEEREPMGTAGALDLAKEWFEEPFVMCNADELKDIDLTDMFEQHRKTKALATIALTEVEEPSRYGVVKLHGKRIVQFIEKPKSTEAMSNLINAGLYILDPKALTYVPKGFSMIEKDVFPLLAREGKLAGYTFDGQWFDTGTKERYLSASQEWKGFSHIYSPLFAQALYAKRGKATA